MSCESNTSPKNATPPGPAIAPGAELIDPRRVAEELVLRHGGGGIDPRVRELAPGFDAPFFQAGLCGYSDAAMRIVARRHGCPFCVTEALLDRTLLAGGRGFAKADLGEIEDNVPGGAEDHPLAGQIMGSDPREMAAAALKMVEQGRRGNDKAYRMLAYERPGVLASQSLHARAAAGMERAMRPDAGPAFGGSLAGAVLGGSSTFEVIDVNLACPVKKIDRKARGGHWLAEPAGAIAILEAVREAVPAEIPCAVKLRRSYDDTPEMAVTFERVFEAAYAMGYAWTTVHARTVEQKYIGPSRWPFLRDLVRRHPEKIIFGSGDIWEAEDIFRMIAYTGVHAVSVARGCIGNPWIFRQARALLAGEAASPPTIAEQRAVLEEHFNLAMAVNVSGRGSSGSARAEAFTGRTMRKFGIRFAAHHPRGDEVRKRMVAVSSLGDWRDVLEEFYTPGEGARVRGDARHSAA